MQNISSHHMHPHLLGICCMEHPATDILLLCRLERLGKAALCFGVACNAGQCKRLKHLCAYVRVSMCVCVCVGGRTPHCSGR